MVKETISLVDPLKVNEPQDPEFFQTTKLVMCECKNGGGLERAALNKYISQLGPTWLNLIWSINACAFLCYYTI